jgi:hypothetical protein
MSQYSSYRLTGDKIVSEVIDGEAVLINLDLGNYYSLDKIGTEVWQLMSDGYSDKAIAQALTLRYTASADEVFMSLQRFIAQLLDEGIITRFESTASGLSTVPQESGVRMPFTPPTIMKYTDMQDLLLIDPIHEVDDTGWPNIAAATDAV